MRKRKPLPIITVGDERLHEKSLPVEDYTPELAGFVDEMFRSLHSQKGLGLAAVQVGHLIRVFITHIPEDEPRILINPEILETAEEQISIEEGCLSVPNKYEHVLRPFSVRVQAFTVQGKPFSLAAEGIFARVIQHEIDHINGILFIDRIDEKRRNEILKSFRAKVII
jgi:peptide deformylase